jgi:hypothetical protein
MDNGQWTVDSEIQWILEIMARENPRVWASAKAIAGKTPLHRGVSRISLAIGHNNSKI